MKDRIAKIRKERGHTLQALADSIGVSSQQIRYLEKERRGLTVVWLERIAIAMDCHPFDRLEAPRAASYTPTTLTSTA